VVESEIVRGLGLVVVLGVGLQWAARWLRMPSIVLLLAGGLAVGPGLGWVEPDEIFGDALFPVVSLAVAVLLFNGGLELRFDDLRGAARGPVLRLVTVGALATWLLTATAAHLLYGEPVRVSLLLGAILVVSGPTVVGPLLRLARPADPDATILQWEGIVIDPLGATLGVFCVNAFFVSELTPGEIWVDVVVVALAGVAAGLVGAALLVAALRRLLVPDDLEVAVALAMVVGIYAVAESVRPEAGLFATTTLGLALANQRIVPVRQLRGFGQPIVVLLIGTLFIVLAARVEAGPLVDHLPEALGLAAVLVLVVRPLVVALCTWRHPLSLGERAFLACLAPRGVVAAATAALFTLRLEQIGQDTSVLVPAVFAVIIVLAVIYGLGAVPAARWLGVARPRARGALVVSGQPWALGLAGELARHGLPTVLVARGRADLDERDDLPFTVHTGPIRELPASGLLADVAGAIIASRDDEVDLVALGVVVTHVGRGQVWLLPSEPEGGRPRDASVAAGAGRRDGGHQRRWARGLVRTGEDEGLAGVESWARRPFGPGVTHARLDAAAAAGHEVRMVPAADVGPDAMVLAILTTDGGWTVDVGDVDRAWDPGDRLIVLDPVPDRTGAGGGPAGSGSDVAGQGDGAQPQAGASTSRAPGGDDETGT
jgi:NhaP-type Na+/H+ or K+/H+ antiporter